MKHNRMGGTGLRLSELGLGTLTFGREADFAEAGRIVGGYLDAGGCVFDSADSYTGGLAEEYLGKHLQGRRDQVIIATKARFPTGPGPNDRGASRRHLLDSLEHSLRRLQTDWIDICFVHCWDPHTALDETLSTLDMMVQSGKVRYVGASNFAGWQLATALGLSRCHGWEPFRVLQPQYSLICRSTERELLPLCESERLGVIAWSPLGGGMLTGKYRPDGEHPGGTRAADSVQRGSQTMSNRFTPQNHAVVDLLRELAGEYGYPPAQIAIAWVVRQPLVTTTLLGARTAGQLQAVLGSPGCQLPEEAWQRLAAASRPPPEYPYDLLEYATTV